MNSTLKNILIFVLIFGVLAGGYYFFIGNKTEEQGLTSIDPVTGTEIASVVDSGVGSEFLSTLLNIKNIKLDNAIFLSSAFRYLQDYTTELVEQGNAGRVNPFAPIGIDSVSSTQSATTLDSVDSTTNTEQIVVPVKSGKKQ